MAQNKAQQVCQRNYYSGSLKLCAAVSQINCVSHNKLMFFKRSRTHINLSFFAQYIFGYSVRSMSRKKV
jgi:hypothetical protein